MALVFGLLIMAVVDVAIKADGIWESELGKGYGKKIFVEKVLKATRDCLMVIRNGVRELWCTQILNPVYIRGDGNIVGGLKTTK